jgi:hypothetical protein
MRCENKPLLQDDPGFLQEITSIAVEVGLGFHSWSVGCARRFFRVLNSRLDVRFPIKVRDLGNFRRFVVEQCVGRAI